MKTIVLWMAFLAASAAFAQPLTVGIMPNATDYGFNAQTAPTSFIDVTHPATSNGTVNRASVRWSADCSGAFKLAFLRRQTIPSSFTVTAVRGPFDATAGRVDLSLVPPVSVEQGDLIAIVQLKPGSTCGAPFYQPQIEGQSAVWVTINDISAGGTLAALASLNTDKALAAIAFNADPVLVRVVPAAGAVQGVGAFFRTSLQLFNDVTHPNPVTGKLVFHRAGVPGSDSDPSLPFSIGYHQTLSFADVVAAMNVTGLGSLDVFVNGGQELVVSAKIFSDAGASGTSGFTEDGLAPSEARRSILGTGSVEGVLLLPADLANFRMNAGVRSLESGATLTIKTYDAGGAVVATRSNVTYPSNYFEQVSASQFTGLSTLPAGGSILVSVDSGSAFIYASITDNRTQDSSMRLAELK